MSVAAHLPALQVVVPLIAAPLIVLLRRRRGAFVLACAAAWAALAIAVALWLRVGAEGPISYAIGNWAPPLGIEYRVDALAALVLVLVAGVAAVALPYCARSVAAEIPASQQYLFYAMFTLSLTGLLGMTITGDAFNVFVFLEISSLSTYVLIALGRDRRALLASYQYLIMGTIGATFFVIGVGLLYLLTGTLNLQDLAERLAGVEQRRPLLAALAFLTVGLGLKLALFPLHQWLPGAYTHAPSVVSAFLAGTATKVAVYVLLRFYFSVLDANPLFGDMPWAEAMLALSILAMFVASAQALWQGDLKGVLAYSSLGQIGYITLGIGLASEAGLTGTVMHLVNHGVTKSALFLFCGCLALRAGGTRLTQLAGVARRMPWTSAGLLAGGLGLIGVPGTAGFASKWMLVGAALEQGNWPVAAAIVASSLIAVAYVWRVVEVACFREAAPGAARAEAPLSMLIPAWLLIALTLVLGFSGGWVAEVARGAVRAMEFGA
jgi:multicomponent Na+:H+ antiporter subunit D